MKLPPLDNAALDALRQALGYLNFSSGAPDPRFLASLNVLCGALQEGQIALPAVQEGQQETWQRLGPLLQLGLTDLKQTGETFRDHGQASVVLELVFDHVLPGYREFHADLLFHQSGEALFRPFFIGRAVEAVLDQKPPWQERERITKGAIRRLNDYVGHRPLAVLQSQRLELYPHERVCPVPLYVEGAGVSVGPYHDLVAATLEILQTTDEDLLQAACFFPDQLAELAFDPRAYDFDHPANKRPNYHFGQWDLDHIDNHGFYRRYVIQQVTLDALMRRLRPQEKIPPEELLHEGAAVLAGTILMASGICGWGPGSHVSTTSLGTLLPHIAAYRDEFYERLLAHGKGSLTERLREEAQRLQQPYGAARQHLNAELARCRAEQLEHVQLARIFARMGYPKAARRQTDDVAVVSARIRCRIDCLLVEADRATAAGEPDRALQLLKKAIGLVHRGIECGGLVDPWNILGFDANYSVFPALENSIRDHRVDELVEMVDELLAQLARVWSAAAAIQDSKVVEEASSELSRLAEWWRQFAAHEVSSVEAEDPQKAQRATQRVAEAMKLWHQGGASAGDVRFWAPHVEVFESPRAYVLVIEALLERGDFVASMGLLMHWLSRADEIPVEEGERSFCRLARRWMQELLIRETPPAGTGGKSVRPLEIVGRFLDYFEANADRYGRVPHFELGAARAPDDGEYEKDSEEEDDIDELYSAAYEDVVYRDSTDDGMEGAVFDEQAMPSDEELEREGKRLARRLGVLACQAELWKLAALAWLGEAREMSPAAGGSESDEAKASDDAKSSDEAKAVEAHRRLAERFGEFSRQTAAKFRGILELMEAVQDYRLPLPAGDHESLLEYDRLRLVKETLLERIIAVAIELADVDRIVAAAANLVSQTEGDDAELLQIGKVYRAALHGRSAEVAAGWDEFLEELGRHPLLYVPLTKGGKPREIVTVRVRQRAIGNLLDWLPRLGLIRQACQLIESVRKIERRHSAGPGAVTEFDELFEAGFRALVESLVAWSSEWGNNSGSKLGARGSSLMNCLEQLTEALLQCWLNHSRTLRLSVLERVADEDDWKSLVDFVKRYGAGLFTQQFLNLGNVRGILHEGVENWIEQLQSQPHLVEGLEFFDDLGEALPREASLRHLSFVLESVLENYNEYRDYNSTTTQSDHGEAVYTFLDFLRLRSQYDRVAWNLKPVVLAHEVLVRRGRHEESAIWRNALRERIADEADRYLKNLTKLQDQYAMRMPTVADRINERFLRPLLTDRMRALVEPAMRGAGEEEGERVFDVLEEEAVALSIEPTGVGLDVPVWLLALEEEVQRLGDPCWHPVEDDLIARVLPYPSLTSEEVEEQIAAWSESKSGEK